jgi:transaldolase/glucose-6-phosphate isomerase
VTEHDPANLTRRLIARDASLWPGEAAGGWLGWLDAPAEARALVAGVPRASGAVVLLGMGGSSLAPYVFAQALGLDALVVVDSTDPDAVRAMPVEGSSFVVSSKSGSTVEPNCLLDYALGAIGGDTSRVSAITDPGSSLEKRAAAEGFAHTYAGRPDVGGRYSALSAFGVVPATMCGAPMEAVLDEAIAYLDDGLPGAGELGAALGEHARAGRDKLTVIASPGLERMGLWLEQLVAESTGKAGTGILPVAGERLAAPDRYGGDRVFLHVRADATHDAALAELAAAGHPVIDVGCDRPTGIGREMLRYEAATAIAGHVLGIDPFDQPNVQEAKDATVALLAAFEGSGELPDVEFDDLAGALARVEPGRSYVCLQAFVQPTDAAEEALASAQADLRDALGCAVTAGFGPRYLHSTGQYHKGGPPHGVFVQVVSDPGDLPIPGRSYGFRTLRDAQAAGDAQALRGRGMPVARIHLDELSGAVAAARRRSAR